MTEQELKQYWGEEVHIITHAGKEYEAFAELFEDSYDNDPEEACLTLRMPYGLVSFGLSEIASIEIIK